MFFKLLRRGALAVLALGIVSTLAHANQPIPVLFDARFHWNIDLKVGPDAFLPRAPWYTYFPADPNMAQPGPMTPFPNWPAQFPTYGPALGSVPMSQGSFVQWQTPTPMYYNRPAVQPVNYYAPTWGR